MSVASSISSALKRFGRPMVLRRLTLAAGNTQIPLDVTVYGTAKGATTEKLVGPVAQADTIITISNAEIASAQWPGPPKKDDRFIYDGLTKTVLGQPESKYLGADVLVHVCMVKG